MPERDSIHSDVKQALINDGWIVTDDPYVISYGERFLFVDLGASEINIDEHAEGQFIGAQRGTKRIAIEIKKFIGKSAMFNLEQAIGQYVLYRLLLQKVDPKREIYLAITDTVYDEIFSEPVGELVVSELPLKLLIINLANKEVTQWITPQNIGKS